MPKTLNTTRNSHSHRFSRLKSKLNRSPGHFCRDENGSIMIFSLMAFIVMVLLTGIAIDVLRQETSRIKLQNTLDRAILAAANLDQELDPELVVRDYFEKAGMTRFLGKITVESDAKRSYRTVTANATASVPTMFMHWKGVDIDHLDAVAGGRAEERITNVEISLILDISGSMGGTKIATLRTAGQDFVDEVLKDTSVDRVSISLIPYTAQVNAGPEILSLMNLTSTPRHNFSHCIEFTPADFTRAGWLALASGDGRRDYYQGQHIHRTYDEYARTAGDEHPISRIRNPTCPRQLNERISYQSKHQPARRLCTIRYGNT